MGISSLFVPLLRSLAEWEMHFAIDISRLPAPAIRCLAETVYETVEKTRALGSEFRFQAVLLWSRVNA